MAAYVVGKDGEQLTELNSPNPHTNVFAAVKLLATYADSNTYFALSDWLRAKRVEVTTSGNRCETYTSLPYGDELIPSGPFN